MDIALSTLPPMRTYFIAAILVATALGSVGCANPRVVRGITSRADQVKFLYIQGGDTGIVRCQMGADGALSNCHNVAVVLED